MNFDIGEIPEGWRRGDRLDIIQIGHKGGRGAVVHVELTPLDVNTTPVIGALEFTQDMAKKVNAWLEWWRATQ